ncbi:TIGR02301 family protein [Rhizobium sp. CFBP 8762]|uniref:TIGR02301 family protein n=1 Tax=Rhizobium sp. CFBP 8762 TaxID=2775279 RepID=UPI00178734FE|nr:TIGR02301 family protein [Rhizobium sp. CFBP 8762]MBD8553093.1 TIGR02301 family protein [Rhizobium sp. CFBP 8762]
MKPFDTLLASVTACACLCSPVQAQLAIVTPPQQSAPYDEQLGRLSEILGSVHYLRTLCKQAAGPDWRQSMQDLLNGETANEEERKARLTASFNRGYRAFASVYTACTPAAIAVEEAYRAKGATLVSEITARFGN